MANFDAGSYFLTTLAPIRPGATQDIDGSTVSFRQRLATTLATLPTALQSPATERTGVQSPFAQSLRTHLCRFAIIDDAIYNGRPPRNPVLTSLFGPDPIVADRPDRLNAAYLMFTAEIDAVTEDGAALPATLSQAEQDAVRDAWARDIWAKMPETVAAIWGNCVGFQSVDGPDSFARYLARCQVETTMPFHDYWIAPPDLPRLPVKLIAAVALAPLAALALSLAGWAAGAQKVPLLGLAVDWAPWPTAGWAALASAAALWGVYRYAMAHGARPFPPPARADLPSVLKALFVRERLADFAIAQQGADAEALHKAFGAFLAACKPEDATGPTQPPGVVRAPAPEEPDGRTRRKAEV